ncbi:DUF438 domain-containing protein [Lactobacillus sp. 23-2]|uniref:DUF438 domain-containing protein n=1 Tax=Lactobacillus sp. 23-2 TaxID=2981842 RepID=UPI00383375D5
MTEQMSLEERKAKLAEILRILQEDGDFDQAKARFKAAFDQVSVREITEAERALIAGGLNPAEIQNLCTVHAEVFRGAIGQSRESPAFARPGHPVHTLKLENMVIASLVNDALLPDLDKYVQDPQAAVLARIRQELADLRTIGKHYARKEISIFPLMTKYGITTPPQVMWGVDDDIRGWIREAAACAEEEAPDREELSRKVKRAAKEVTEMIFKEEAIMVPLLADVASPDDWRKVKEDEPQFGYTLINPPVNWRPSQQELADFAKKPRDLDQLAKNWNEQISAFAGQLGGNEKANYDAQLPVAPAASASKGPAALGQVFLQFAQGGLNFDQLSAILDLLPFDLAFVDKDDIIRYFGGNCGFYPHSANDLGMNLFSIHMPKSVAKVKQIVADLRSGKKDKHEFWFELRGRFVYIQYIAVRDQQGQYMGVLEVLQDATHVRGLQGNKKEL